MPLAVTFGYEIIDCFEVTPEDGWLELWINGQLDESVVVELFQEIEQ
jgi:hypothetical protein